MLWKHRVYTIGQIHRGGALVPFFVQRCLRYYIMAHIGYVYTYFVPATSKRADGDGIIKIFGIYRIDGKSKHPAKIAAYFYFMLCNSIRQAGSFFQCIITKRQ